MLERARIRLANKFRAKFFGLGGGLRRPSALLVERTYGSFRATQSNGTDVFVTFVALSHQL